MYELLCVESNFNKIKSNLIRKSFLSTILHFQDIEEVYVQYIQIKNQTV